ncbi:MAG: hypothetical protein AAB701_01500 [Patescibacteria group bacterium]
MSAEAILQESWLLFRTHWRYLAVIAAINLVFSLIISVAVTFLGVTSLISLSANLMGGSPWLSFAIFVAFLALLASLIAPVLTGATAVAARTVLGKKQTIDYLAPYREALTKYSTLLGVTVVVGAAVIGGFILLVIPGLIALVLLTPAVYLVFAEGGSVQSALERSVALGKAHTVTISFLLLTVGLASVVGSWLLSHVPLVGDLASAYGQSLVTVFGMLVIAVFHKHATR